MKKFFLLGLAMLLPTFMFAASNGTLDMGTAKNASTSVLDLIFLGAKIVGAIAIILGIVELLVEKDQGGQQGKKVTGSMKLMGGILLLLAASVISWMVGDPDAKSSKDILGTGTSSLEVYTGNLA